MTAILEMPQYVVYLQNIACGAWCFILGVTKLIAKSHSFNILCTTDVLSCHTIKCRAAKLNLEISEPLKVIPLQFPKPGYNPCECS